MYLSRLAFNPRSRRVYGALRDAYRTHAMLSRAFPPGLQSRMLFRTEPSRFTDISGIVLLVQSVYPPDWGFLASEFGGAVSFQAKEVSPAFRRGQLLRFRLRANPTVKRDGKRFGLIGDGDQILWLKRKGERGGFEIEPENILAVDEGHLRAVKRTGDTRHVIRVKTVLFEGILTVADPDVFSTSIEGGVGPAKGIGCGLLSLAVA